MKKLLALIPLLPLLAHASFVSPFSFSGQPFPYTYALSRASGTAPLGITVSAVNTTDTAVTAKPFHDINYTWAVTPCTGSPTWSTGSKPGTSKCTGQGPLWAFVFETAGSYTITGTAFDGTNTATAAKTVTVADPATTFTATNTICLSIAADPTPGAGGCPAASAHHQITDFCAAVSTYMATGKRLIFNRGETYPCAAPASVVTAGPNTIGMYGTGATPLITSAGLNVLSLPNSAVNDLRIMDLNITGDSSSGGCASITANVSNVTFLRLECHDIGFGIVPASGSNLSASIVQDSQIYNLYTIGHVGIFGWWLTSAFMGNTIGPFVSAEHNLRLQPGQQVSITNNTLSHPGTTDKQVLTVRAEEHFQPGSGGDTQYVYVGNNKLDGDGSVQMFQVAPASITQNDQIYDVVIENNWMLFGTVTQDGYYSEGTRLTVRNNLCNTSGGAAFRTCYSVAPGNTAGVPPPDDNTFYNNDCYASDNSSQMNCISIDATNRPINNSAVKNNLGYAPANASSALLVTAGAPTVATGGNSTNVQMRSIDPLFTTTPPIAPASWKPTAGSYVITNGVTVPTWADFFLVPDPPRTTGAVNP